MAIPAEQDSNVRPVDPDRPHQTAQVGADLSPTRPLGRSQDRADEPSRTIEHDDRLEAVLVRLWTTWSGQRGSSMQRARRSATRNRFSTSAKARTPLLDDSMPPSKRATTD
ncbi:hypothetical protein X728_32180 [Mesorhizobium sp. L103C120A0]|nr:hypothetical protein X728_32180 [Mesorhizobium sp. L103C120A0]